MYLWAIIFVANAINNVLTFVHAILDMRRSMYERNVTPRMWYYQGFYDWTEQGGHGVYIRYDNGKTRLVRTFPNSTDARCYLRHKAKSYVDESTGEEQLYAESPNYEHKPYKVYTGDRNSTLNKDKTC